MRHAPPRHLSSRLGIASLLPFLAGMGGPTRIVGLSDRHRREVYSKPHQGLGEIARRRRQIEMGQLTKSNGLVDHG